MAPISHPLPSYTLERPPLLARQFLAGLPLSTPVPSIGAEPDGPERTLSVSIGRDGDLHYAALLGAERICETETFRARMPQVLRDLIARIDERDTESFSR